MSMPDTEFKRIPVDSLEFDMGNPRLPRWVGRSEKDMLDYLMAETAIEDLIASIGENGFFPGEAVIVCPSAHKSGNFTVLEGNRRLAAVRLLQNPVITKKKRIIDAVDQSKYQPSEIPAVIVNGRKDVLQYLGFRHIAGIQPWQPLAKARYLEQLFGLTSPKESPDERCRIVAREIGSRSDAVRRNLDALAAYNIIETKEILNSFDIEESDVDFGVFYTALSNKDIGKFVGVRDKDNNIAYPIVNVGAINDENLQKIVKYMFVRDKNGVTVLGDSRNIGKLGEIVADLNALKSLEEGASLDRAYRLISGGAEADFKTHLHEALDALEQAGSILYNQDRSDSSSKKIIGDIIKAADLIQNHFQE